MVLLTLMAIVTIGVVRLRNLFAVVILGGIYSFLMASVLIVLDAVDVAMTEASVGAGISTVLMLATLYLTKTDEAPARHSPFLPLLLAIVVAGMLVYGTMDLPPFGAADTAMHGHVGPKYLSDAIKETGVPNIVTAVLADYRGFDTLGEVTVIFTAGIGVLVLLKGRAPGRKDETQAGDGSEGGAA
jgi:multicomponent Na+:H+ antiporter subunit B